MVKAILPQRHQDSWGSGAFGASRGTRVHKGIDYCCYPGTVIQAGVAGTVSKLGYPYGDDLSFRYVEITTPDQLRHRYFYVEPLVKSGDAITEGMPIGTAQDIAGRYRDPAKAPMTGHVHFEILQPDGTPINPGEI